jgi:uncharacterized protein YcbX
MSTMWEAVVQAAIGGQAATQVIQGEKLFDLVVRMDPEFRGATRDRQSARAHAGRSADTAVASWRHPRSVRRIVHLPRKQFALHRRAVFSVKGETSKA